MADAHDAATLVERLFGAALGGFDLLCVYIGDRLGLYRALADAGPMTAGCLADAAAVHPRYAREWLEQQAMSGILAVDDPDLADDERRFRLPSAHAEVLLDESSVNFMTPIAQLFVACTGPLGAVVEAFRSGGGVPYADYGRDLQEGQARFSRILFDNLLTSDWLPAVPGLHERLTAEPPARAADIACGLGRSTVAMARGYPLIRVDGIDLDEASIVRAHELLATEAGPDLAGRVTFLHGDAASADLAGGYDLVTIFEALHDMSDPVGALRAARGLLGTGGVVLIGDELTADRFSPDAGDVERLYYGFSVTHCLPVGMVGADPAGTGTVMRAGTVARYARDAGFGTCEILAIENDFWRFYLLRP